MPDSPPLPNDPAARTPDGTIIDQSSTQPTATPTPTTTPPATSSPEPSTRDPATTPEPPAVPESYTFKAPEGATVDQTLVDAATPIFKELGLTQAQADKLVDLYNSRAQSDVGRAIEAIKQMGKEWETKTLADPDIGPNLDKVKTTIAQSLDIALTPTERKDFADAMNQTMVGNHPAFVKAFYKLAQKIAPGTHVNGAGPSEAGQNPKGATSRPSLASSLWPSLPTS